MPARRFSNDLIGEPSLDHGPPADAHSDRDLADLDDEADREELRRRYYGLLQELRVVLPGVQVLLAFLLTAPFAQRFDELTTPGRAAFGIALVSAMFSVICLLAPTMLHRLAERTARRARLRWAIRFTLLGLALLAVALVSAMWCVAQLIYGPLTAWLIAVPAVVGIVVIWIVVPLSIGRIPRRP